MQLDRLQVLFAVFAAHRRRQLRVPARLDIRRTRLPASDGTAAGHCTACGSAREVIWKVEEDSTDAFPDHGSIDAVVVYPPHSAGVPSGAREPPKKFRLRSSNGSCGGFLERRDQLARHRVRRDLSGELDHHSRDRISRDDVQRDQRSRTGSRSCVARYAAPTSGFGSSGVSISTVPTFEDSGQRRFFGVFQTDLPSSRTRRGHPRAAGFSATPAGSVTVVFLTVDCASPSGSAPRSAARGSRPSTLSGCSLPARRARH